MNVKDYLARINITRASEPSLAFLKKLQNSHVESIPWENLDIFFKKNVYLEPDIILKKFIQENRGGICFELNGAYHQLLVDLGFKAKLVSATLFGFNDKRYLEPRDTHIVIIVEIDNDLYLTDVGWNGFRNPISLSAGEFSNDIAGIHKVSSTKSGAYCLEKKIEDVWYTQYQFSDISIALTEVTHHLDVRNASPENEAAHQLLFMQHTPNGFVLLMDDKIIVQEDNAPKREHPLAELGGLRHILLTMFRVTPDAVEQLLPTVVSPGEALSQVGTY